MKKKAKALKQASTKNKIIKPVKAFTGLEIALISGAGTLLAGELMKPKAASASPFKDPFKQYDPAMTPAQYVAKQTSASDVAGEALDPVTSASESATKDTMTTDNEQEEKTVTMKRGGMVRGQGIALRGTKFKGVF